MSDPAAAMKSLYDNLPTKTGKSLAEWFVILDATGLERHGELLAALKTDHALTHGFANAIVLAYRSQGAEPTDDDLVSTQYAGAKAALLPIYEALVSAVAAFGDVEVSPKKTSVSIRRSKQFAVIEPASAKRIQVGIQLKGEDPTERLQAWGAMCSHKVSVTTVDEVDAELIGWLRAAFERA
jgi:hypothetical protein